ncbi:hypothetical protein SFRURICE_016154 [Spodoptera frugiperda]|nr:hypothetical protein SFRURICE_016154 [Spodoptera frugiperda]
MSDGSLKRARNTVWIWSDGELSLALRPQTRTNGGRRSSRDPRRPECDDGWGSCTYGLPPPPSSTTIGPLIAGNPRGKRAADAVATPEERNEAIARATATATAVGGASHGPME